MCFVNQVDDPFNVSLSECIESPSLMQTHSQQLDVGVCVHAEGGQGAAVLLQGHTAGTHTALILQEACRGHKQETAAH